MLRSGCKKIARRVGFAWGLKIEALGEGITCHRSEAQPTEEEGWADKKPRARCRDQCVTLKAMTSEIALTPSKPGWGLTTFNHDWLVVTSYGIRITLDQLLEVLLSLLRMRAIDEFVL